MIENFYANYTGVALLAVPRIFISSLRRDLGFVTVPSPEEAALIAPVLLCIMIIFISYKLPNSYQDIHDKTYNMQHAPNYLNLCSGHASCRPTC